MTRTNAAHLAVEALENLGITRTFGIPGVHNTELYDALADSESITPVLVTSEFNGSFMADATSRVGGSTGTLALVPAAGLTHAASGIGEAYLDGIPVLVITGGVRRDQPYGYQLHEIDQLDLAKGMTKAAFRVTDIDEVAPTIYEAYRIAHEGTPGPVLVELPLDLQLLSHAAAPVPPFAGLPEVPLPPAQQLDKAVDLLLEARHPVLYVGWGARGGRLVELAEQLEMPVTTTLQGLAVFPHDHPLHAGFGFGPAAVPAARNAFAKHDVMLAVGVRFGEIATGSFGIDPPKGLIHVDINPEVFDRNYPAALTLEGDGPAIVEALLERLADRRRPVDTAMRDKIAEDKRSYHAEVAGHQGNGRVNPARLFDAVHARADQDVIVTVDDGNHTFLTAELWTVSEGAELISPTDFNAMGYAVPAAVGAKLAHPEREVVSFVGDGCFRMTGTELATAAAHGLGVVVYVFNDGDLAQIAQAQALPYNRKTCTVLPEVAIEHLARATGATALRLTAEDDLESVVDKAHEIAATGVPVVVDVHIDYSRKTAFTSGIIGTNFKRFPLRDKGRMVRRAVTRRITER
jgi:acetolactate synthase-1/2/3 large subunit